MLELKLVHTPMYAAKPPLFPPPVAPVAFTSSTVEVLPTNRIIRWSEFS